MRPCNKDKVLWKDWCFEVIQKGLIFLGEVWFVMLDLVVILNGALFRFILFIYPTGFPVCCSICNSSFLPEVPVSDCNPLFMPTCLTENK